MPATLTTGSYHELGELEVIRSFNSDRDTGLSAEEVARCYEQYGRNELQVKPGKPATNRR